MFGSVILEIAIGLILVYLLLGLICTAINEVVAQALQWRARTLADGIRNLLADPNYEGLARQVYNHHLIKAFSRRDAKPSYLPPHSFALALLDVVMRDHSGQLQDLKTAVDKLPNEKVRQVLRVFVDQTAGNVLAVQKQIEQWFNDAADRMSGWYKRRMQKITLFFACLVTVLTNADTIMIANNLAQDAVLRAAVVAQAEGYLRESVAADSAGTARAIKNLQAVRRIGLVIGWEHDRTQDWQWITKIIGLVLTSLAASLGAPFWFDLLNRVVNLRGAGKPPAMEPPKPASS
ncbi:MAG: hypothetical protein ONB48_06965 [candidate division KSB1 bacterium]|nr:hypothetical protein [candidate division KSB1 bacterium]MDZ7273283.1 hypothetical protein [candidate division KSB1 bacterium]MDZ7285385.1 hypothetical protein [candidate division KSB1 bacterium]MDZ7298417.1 hypothetical protein [candidate division KSB1 bacterium]MDZ7307682.1 hypothetical protein [candidate division KSB1 bacterium]